MKLCTDMKKVQIDNLPIDAAEVMSEMLAREIDKQILSQILDNNEEDNIEVIKNIFPTKNINDVCEDLGIKDLKREFQLKEKIRNWKINKFLD